MSTDLKIAFRVDGEVEQMLRAWAKRFDAAPGLVARRIVEASVRDYVAKLEAADKVEREHARTLGWFQPETRRRGPKLAA
jgi:hypothetical protein